MLMLHAILAWLAARVVDVLVWLVGGDDAIEWVADMLEMEVV